MTPALQAVVDRAPDGATIRFPPGARYRLGETLHLDGRHDLALDGRGTTFQAGPGDGPGQPVIVLVGSSRITLRDGSTYDVRWLLSKYGGTYRVRDAMVYGFWMTPFLRKIFEEYIAQHSGNVKALVAVLNK